MAVLQGGGFSEVVDDLLAAAKAAGVRLWTAGDTLYYSGPHKAIARLLPDLAANEDGLVSALAGAPNLGIISDLKWLAERHEGPLLAALVATYQTSMLADQAKARAMAHLEGLVCQLEGVPPSARH
jgi:hypothetical protein